ncbi:MAG: polysaccharide pyruvyl transferase family protein [Nitrososphaeria archaeon]
MFISSKYPMNALLRLNPSYENVGDLAINRYEIRFLLKNEHIHKVFLVTPQLFFKGSINAEKSFIEKSVLRINDVPKGKEVLIFRDIFDLPHCKVRWMKWLKVLIYLQKLFCYIFVQMFAIAFRLGNLFIKSDNNLLRLSGAVAISDVVLFSGGGYLNDYWWPGHLPSMLLLTLFSKLRKRHVIVFPSTIGPISSLMVKLIIRILFKFVDVIYVREVFSEKFLKASLKVASDKVVKQEDCGIQLLRETFNKNFMSGIHENVLCVNLRPYGKSKSRYVYVMERILDRIFQSEQYGLNEIKMIVMDKSEIPFYDKLIKRISNYCNVNVYRPYTYEEAALMCSDCKAFIGTSFHFLMLAKFFNKPAIGIIPDKYYAVKLRGLKEDFDKLVLLNMDKDSFQYLEKFSFKFLK